MELGKQTGIMAAKILKGEIKASETKYEIFKNPNLYINKSTFEKLGIELTEEISQRAVESFE